MEYQNITAAYVIGPLGERLTMALLPSADTKRWVARRKAEVVAAIEGGLLTLDEACDRYGLSLEELIAWRRGLERAGFAGLRTTKVQHYRTQWERRGA